jgi:hypothetical protein
VKEIVDGSMSCDLAEQPTRYELLPNHDLISLNGGLSISQKSGPDINNLLHKSVYVYVSDG